MKVQPVAINHILLHLDNGEILDINDGTLTPSGGILAVRLTDPTDKQMITSTSTTYDGIVRLEFHKK